LITQGSIRRRWEREGQMDGQRICKKLRYTKVEEERRKTQNRSGRNRGED
jgi:hypothetical protein